MATRKYTVWGLKGAAKAMTDGTVRYSVGDYVPGAIAALTRRIERLTRCSVITALRRPSLTCSRP